MLTIRINGLDGNQLIFEASSVVREPARLPGSTGCLEFYMGTERLPVAGDYGVNYGNVYVMNDHGKTVAAYDLGKWDGERDSPPKA